MLNPQSTSITELGWIVEVDGYITYYLLIITVISIKHISLYSDVLLFVTDIFEWDFPDRKVNVYKHEDGICGFRFPVSGCTTASSPLSLFLL